MPNEKLTTIYAQHTAHLQRVGASQGNAVIPFLLLIERDVQRIFNKYRDRRKTGSNQASIESQIDEVTRVHLQSYISELKQSNRDVGANEADFAVKTFDNIAQNPAVTAAAVTTAQVNALANSTPIQLGDSSFTAYNTMMSNYWRRWTNEVDGLVKNGFVNGQTIDEIAALVMKELRLQKSTASKNLLNRAHRSAKQLAITGTNHYANQARVAFVDENDKLLTGYRLIAVLDSRTSQKCRSLDQKFIPKNSPKLSTFTPPLHIGCRTALVYEVDERFSIDDEDTKRASSFEVDGKRDPKAVSSEGIYYDKMKSLKASDQDDILGPTMGKAFRKLNDPEEFARLTIDSLGNPLTIKEMQNRDNKLGRVLRNQS